MASGGAPPRGSHREDRGPQLQLFTLLGFRAASAPDARATRRPWRRCGLTPCLAAGQKQEVALLVTLRHLADPRRTWWGIAGLGVAVARPLAQEQQTQGRDRLTHAGCLGLPLTPGKTFRGRTQPLAAFFSTGVPIPPEGLLRVHEPISGELGAFAYRVCTSLWSWSFSFQYPTSATRHPQGSVLPHKTRHTSNGDPLPSMPFTASSSSPSVPTGIRSASLHAAVPGRLPSGAHTSSSVKSSQFCSFNANPHTLGDFSIQVGDPSVHLAPCAPLLSPNLAQPQCPCDHTLELVQGLHPLKRPTSDVSKLFPLMPPNQNSCNPTSISNPPLTTFLP